MTINQLPDCCQPKSDINNSKGVSWGFVSGIIPHSFCILMIILSVIGATTGQAFFGKILATNYFFPLMIGVSFVFATISAIFYLKKIGRLNTNGIVQKKQYLMMLFSITIIVNLLMGYVIIPSIGRISNKTSKNQGSVAIQDNQQIIYMDQSSFGYKPNNFTVKKNIPVKWVISSKEASCSSSIYSKDLQINKSLNIGENIIEFTPTKTGKISFSCSMGMYRGYFNVVE